MKTFDLPLRTSIVPAYAAGSATPNLDMFAPDAPAEPANAVPRETSARADSPAPLSPIKSPRRSRLGFVNGWKGGFDGEG